MAGNDRAAAAARATRTTTMVGMSRRRSRTKSRRPPASAATRNNEARALALACLLALLMAGSASSQATSGSPGATNAYGEPIKWSFGGWAPLDGQQPARNASERTTPAMASSAVGRNQTAPREALSAAASQPIQYSQPAEPAGPNPRLALGPAYALRPPHFSAPAPAPILRERPRPRPRHQQARGNPDRYRRPHGPTMHVLHTQHFVQHQAPPELFRQQRQQVPMASAGLNYQRQLQHHERLRHMHHMQRLAARHQHQLMLMQQQQQQQQQQRLLASQQQVPRQQMGPHQVGAYRLVEGEQPVMFSQPQGDHIPVLEVSSQQQQQRNASEAHLEGHLNYQSAPAKEREQPPSNNIHDVKQRQLEGQPGAGRAAAAASYLTIPVAVETDGDKVLTADDINEIEKHVIQVLPNLKTADQIVKVADDQISVANYNNDSERPALGQIMHQLSYDEHQTTMKELEGDLKQQQRPYESSTTASSPASSSSSSSSSSSQATTPSEPAQSSPQQLSDEEQYFVATGPLQEVGELDQEQLAEYNLIKNDLLHNFRYEPTRAHAGRQQPQRGSTAPMAAAGGHTAAPPGASSTRYFQQGGGGYGGRNRGARPTTKATMMGRKVSDVMRPLIRTTPVPMASPAHVPSLEPEKLDAIQLIAGQANDRRPMVVEAHQLVNHTPDGGIDYNSGGPPPNASAARHEEAPAEEAPRQPEPGALIEYVGAGGQQQVYEVSGQPVAGPMSAQQQQASVAHSEPHLTSPYAPEAGQEQLAAWSPNVASEHQQQQLELGDHAQHMAAELPATAGYNFFQLGQQEQATSATPEEPQQQPRQQQQQQQQQPWRTKAGGRQPNPDAQYDGQIAKGEQEQEQEPAGESQGQQEQQYQQQQSADMDLGPRPEPRPEGHQEQQQQQQQQQQVDNGSGDNGYQGQQRTTPMAPSQATPDGYQQHSTNSYVGGAQINHQHSHQDRQEQPQYSYTKLDRDRQQSHLQQQQAQHQARLQELQQQQAYQTTTPAAMTTAPAEQQDSNNGYLAEQSRPSVQSQPEAMMINESPLQMPVLDQQSLIGDANQETNEQLSDDDGAKQRGQQPVAAVYQVYQAYYAPKDHKPLPGYVRLSLEEFNELFRDAEIQYVDRSNMAPVTGEDNNNSAYAGQPEVMRSSASEHQSILVDRRSIERPEKRSSEARQKSARKLSLGRAMKKIISIRNARHFERQLSESEPEAKSAASNSNLKLSLAKTTTPAMMTTRPLPVTSVAKSASNKQHKAAQLPPTPSPTKSSAAKTLKKPTKIAKESVAGSQIKGQGKLASEKRTTKGSSA